MSIFNRPYLKAKSANQNQADLFGEAVAPALATEGSETAAVRPSSTKVFKMAACHYCGGSFQPVSWGIRGASSQVVCSVKCGVIHLERLLPDLRTYLEEKERGTLFYRPEDKDLALMAELKSVIDNAGKINRESDSRSIADAFKAACDLHAKLEAGKVAEEQREAQPAPRSRFGF